MTTSATRLRNLKISEGYLRYRSMGDLPLFETQELSRLAIEAQKGDEEAYGKAIAGCLRYIMREARIWMNQHPRLEKLEAEDLVQDAVSQVPRAIAKYDPSKGEFLTYAKQWIENGFRRASGKADNGIGCSSTTYQRYRTKIVKALNAGVDRNDYDALAEATGLSRTMVAEVLGAFSSTSIDEKASHDGEKEVTLAEIIPSDENWLEALEKDDLASTVVRLVMEIADERTLEVLRMRYGMRMKRPDIAKAIGRTPERVRQLELKLLDAVRVRLVSMGLMEKEKVTA